MRDLKEIIKQKEASFDEITKKIAEHEKEVAICKEELLRLQGEYRLLTELMEEEESTDSE